MTKEIIFLAFRNNLVNTKTQAFEAAYNEGIFNRDLILECFSEWISDDEF
jgi:hypothetical protein